MKALFAFITMAVVILVLIEINERIKAKKKKDDNPVTAPQKDNCDDVCLDCSLLDTCEKQNKKQPKQKEII